MLQNFKGAKKGDIVEFDETEARSYVDANLAEEVTDPIEDQMSNIVKKFDEQIGKSLERKIKELNDLNFDDNATITVGQDPRVRTGGYTNIGEFAADVALSRKQPSEKLQSWRNYTRTLTEGVAADGGDLVPQEFIANLLMTGVEGEVVHPRATIIPMRTNSVRIPAVNTTTHVGSLYGGVIIKRTDEAGQKIESQPAFSHVDLTLNKLTGLVNVSDELLEDSMVSLAPVLNEMFRNSLIFQRDDDYINGTGVGQSEGFLNSPALVVVDAEVGQADNTVVAENIFKMYSRMWPASLNSAVWMVNNSVFPQLMGLTMGGTPVPVWIPNGNISGTPFGSILGRPVIVTEKLPCLGCQGDIVFADLSQYLVGEKTSGIQSATSIHLYFDYDLTTFRFVYRTDGKTWWRSDITPRQGCDTLSPFVTLASRGCSS